MTQVVKAADAGDLLAVIPSLMGFTPSESLIVLPFKDNRTLGAMRVDLPPYDDDAAQGAAAEQIATLAARVEDVDFYILAVFTERSVGDWVGFAELVEERHHMLRLVVEDVLLLGGDGYCSLNEEGMPLRPRSELCLPVDVPAPAASALEMIALPEIADDVAMDVAFALSKLDPDGYDLNEWIENVMVIGQPDRLATSDLALAVLILERPAVRDVFIMQATRGRQMGELALEAQLAFDAGVEYPAHIAETMWGAGDQPDPKRLEVGLEVARWAAAIGERPGALATCAWFSWALGRSTRAEHYAKLALELEPGHGLAEIIAKFVVAGHLPAWAFKRRG